MFLITLHYEIVVAGKLETFLANIVCENAENGKNILKDRYGDALKFVRVDNSQPVHLLDQHLCRSIAYRLYDTVTLEKEAAKTQKAPKPEYEPLIIAQPSKNPVADQYLFRRY